MREPILRDVRDEIRQAPMAEQLLQAMKESNEGPGQFLREMREGLGLSVEDVGGELNLVPKQVIALEENEHELFPAPIYVRSHLRRYAELVGFPVEPVLEAFHRTGENGPPPLRRVSIRQQINSRNATVRWATYLFAVALVILLLAWWQSSGFPTFLSGASKEQVPAEQNLPAFDLTLPAIQKPADAAKDGEGAP